MCFSCFSISTRVWLCVCALHSSEVVRIAVFHWINYRCVFPFRKNQPFIKHIRWESKSREEKKNVGTNQKPKTIENSLNMHREEQFTAYEKRLEWERENGMIEPTNATSPNTRRRPSRIVQSIYLPARVIHFNAIRSNRFLQAHFFFDQYRLFPSYSAYSDYNLPEMYRKTWCMWDVITSKNYNWEHAAVESTKCCQHTRTHRHFRLNPLPINVNC